MKNVQTWAPTKFVLERGRFRASPNPKELSPGSRLLGDLLASCYQTHLKSHCRGRLLDLGCGKVPFYGLYREYVSETVCVDWHNSSHGNDYLDAECDLTKDLPFSDACFDTILLSDVLEQIAIKCAVLLLPARRTIRLLSIYKIRTPTICRNNRIRNHLDQRGWGCTRNCGGYCFKIDLTIRSDWRMDRGCTPGRLSEPGHIASRCTHF
jgi:Methyltransferase domain